MEKFKKHIRVATSLDEEHDVPVDTPDPTDGLLQLDELKYSNLHEYIETNSRTAHVAWGLFFNVTYQISAILTLHRENICYASSPNRRTVVEYGTFLVWLAEDGDRVVDVMNRGLQRDQRNLDKRIRENSMMDHFPAAAYRALQDTLSEELDPESDERLLRPQNLIPQYDPGLMAYYNVESRHSHVSLTSVQYFTRNNGEVLELAQRPIHSEVVPCQAFCLSVQYQSMLAFNTLLRGNPWTEELASIAATHDLPAVLRKRNPSA